MVEPSALMVSSPTLTVFCETGLANRIRVLISALAVAEASGRTLRMLWPRNRACGAKFDELFSNDWPVTSVDKLDPAVAAHHIRRVAPGARLHLLSDPRPDITIGLNGWLIPLGRSSPAALRSRVVALMDELEPCPPVRARIAAFRARHFHPSTIGVHLRRGDFLRHRPDVVGNTPQAMETVDRFLAVAPRARIFLCTDDGARDQKQVRLEGVHAIFRARYGEQVVSTTPRSLERHTVEGVQDALVDLWLLRETSMMVGTRGSSFSDLAVFGRDVPYAMVGGASGRYERFYRLARVTGVDRVVRGLFRAVYGYDRPFPQAWNQLVLGPLRRARERVAWRGIR